MLSRQACTRILARRTLRPYATEAGLDAQEAWLFVGSIFPVRVGKLDPRYFIGRLREDRLLHNVRSTLSSVRDHSFEILSVEPYHKDGGAFIKFKYVGDEETLSSLERTLKELTRKAGGLQSWTGLKRADIWLVKSRHPWLEDMDRWPSMTLRVEFMGGEVTEEQVFDLFRPYGRIEDIEAPKTSGKFPALSVEYRRYRGATTARNVLYGHEITLPSGGKVRLRPTYEPAMHPYAVRDWLSKHPRIVLPVALFLLGSLTYAIFDPIRSLMVEAKMMNWFDYKEYRLWQWFRENALERLPLAFESKIAEAPAEDAWKERMDAFNAIKTYLNDFPNTIAFVHGPQGSGKTRMVRAVLEPFDRPTLEIDCRELVKAPSDVQMIGSLAKQTGYWPIFTFLNSMSNLIDLASVGMIGQKAGLGSSTPDQLRDILSTVTVSLKRANTSHRDKIVRQTKRHEARQARDKSIAAVWGRISSLWAGENAEPGSIRTMGGNEDHTSADQHREKPAKDKSTGEVKEDMARKVKGSNDAEALQSLPTVLIRNFAGAGAGKDEMLEVLAQWATTLAENKIAHVVILSDNRENSKRLAKAMPTKPLYSVALSDADAATSLSYVKQKLQDIDVEANFSSEQISLIQRLGGRASDLESLVHKVRNGQTVEDAVEDIISRGVAELRKNAFGDDADDAKNLPWSREQAWHVLKQLAKQEAIPYQDLLYNFPFKGNENALRSMEQAELITVGTHNGRPSAVRAGKPVYKWVFERLYHDPIFQAAMDISYNQQVIDKAESTIRSCEEELLRLKEIGLEHGWLGRTPPSERANYLFDKMQSAGRKIVQLERKNVELQKVLARGG
ncbi:RNA12 protein-domain-containing protein [Schizophyllum amplum]|uniref:Mitochondrial escape protein 2 n=1 Tax=Schizophyllum amplum TaxID=97359 RepID=A0A550C3L6_9AGAR|nr:RNA12 protein-domain-containing protein [Auriculariopsis ampla]